MIRSRCALYGCFFARGALQGRSLCAKVYENVTEIVKDLLKAHPKIQELFNKDDYKCAVYEIMVGQTKQINESDDVALVIQQLRDQLERSSTELFPFFETCEKEVQDNSVNKLKKELKLDQEPVSEADERILKWDESKYLIIIVFNSH